MDAVAELTRTPWADVWRMSAVEWLNYECYRRDKAEHEKAELEKWKLTH